MEQILVDYSDHSFPSSRTPPFLYHPPLPFGPSLIGLYDIRSLGGRDGLMTLNNVECYDPKSDKWETLTSMLTHRHGLGVAVLSGPIYAVGGHDGWSYLNTVER